MRKRKKVKEMGRNEDFEGVSDLCMTEKAEVYARLRRVLQPADILLQAPNFSL